MDFSFLACKEQQQKKTDIEKADNFLDKAFNKGQDFFRIQLSDLLFEKIIGSGASAEVYKGSYKQTDVAIKKLRFIA